MSEEFNLFIDACPGHLRWFDSAPGGCLPGPCFRQHPQPVSARCSWRGPPRKAFPRAPPFARSLERDRQCPPRKQGTRRRMWPMHRNPFSARIDCPLRGSSSCETGLDAPFWLPASPVMSLHGQGKTCCDKRDTDVRFNRTKWIVGNVNLGQGCSTEKGRFAYVWFADKADSHPVHVPSAGFTLPRSRSALHDRIFVTRDVEFWQVDLPIAVKVHCLEQSAPFPMGGGSRCLRS